jgi:hypothetical protein
MDVAALKKTLMSSVQRRIHLDLFNDTPMEVYVEKLEKVSDSNLVMTGHMDDEDSSVSLVVNDNQVVANIHPENGRRYTIRPQGADAHVIQEFADVEEQGAQSVSNGEDPTCLAVPAPEARVEAPIATDVAMATTPVIDMLVAYTPSALAKMGSVSAMKALIQTGIADTNKSFINSGVNLSVRLVGIMALRQNESDFSGDLSLLRSNGDGKWDEVHAERARLGADQVSVVAVYPNNGVAGIGYIKANAASAFTITKVGGFSQFSFTHELGHNVGLQHSDGMVNSSGSFRTIMAYGSVPRILRFSNPKLSYNNYATGDSSHNSAAILNAYGNTTANLVAPKVSGGGGGSVPPVSGAPSSGGCQ